MGTLKLERNKIMKKMRETTDDSSSQEGKLNEKSELTEKVN